MPKQNMAHDLSEKTRTRDVILEETVSFKAMLLPEQILKGLSSSGFRKPSPIQFKAVPLGRCGFDLIIKSKSGTGKTLVFALVALEAVNVTKKHVQALILVPTREIAVQIEDVLKTIGSCIEGLHVASFIGGMPLEDDLRKVKQCHIAVGAPGRVKHLITLGALSPKHVRLFVLDEADKLMESSFQNDINEIYNVLPPRKQMIASSATYPRDLDTFLAKYMHGPTHISAEVETPMLLGLKHFVSIFSVPLGNVVQLTKTKNEALVTILSKINFTQCLVFSNYQTRAQSVCNFLNHKGWNSLCISAAQSQTKRLETVANLKQFKNRILLSTDLTSRGIDAPNVDLVVNYDVPQDAMTYLHRMGRAGRYGSKGICLTLATQGGEAPQLQKIMGAIHPTLTIPILPLDQDFDIWNIDPSTLEQIHAAENPAEISEIKRELLDLKENNLTPPKTEEKANQINKENDLTIPKTKDSANTSKKEVLSEATYVENVLRATKREEAELEEVYATVGVDDILQSLVSGSIVQHNLEMPPAKEDLEGLLQSLVSSNVEEDNKKRKRDSPKWREERDGDKRHNPVNVTFCKNKALLSITQLVSDPMAQIGGDMVSNIGEYLEILKREPEGELNDTKIEKSNKISSIEEIFKIGYESILSEDSSFIHRLSGEEFQNYQRHCLEKIQLSDSDEDDDDDDDCEMVEEFDARPVLPLNDSLPEDYEDIGARWVPVVPPKKKQVSDVSPQNEHFTQCFDDCSASLWQNGLAFESVENFDDWFYNNWQQQLQSVRNYVQQNIYVQEMSQYQQNLLQ